MLYFGAYFYFMIYLAPLQGFTDFIYRLAYAKIFSDINTYYLPYISMKNDSVLPKYEKEILQINNPQQNVVPQVLAKNGYEINYMANLLQGFGYNEINLNLGCPYPMVTKRGKGSGLLPFPEKIRSILCEFYENNEIQLSIKLRAGFNTAHEIEELIPVLNEFPLKEIILHPRIASQLYSGDIIDSAFGFASTHLNHKLVFNGDIFSLDDYKQRKEQFPAIENWMLGRGVLMNPFLPSEIMGKQFPDSEKEEKLRAFHNLMLESYLEVMDNEGNALNKMQQFWSYFSYNFTNQKKAFKVIKKSKNLRKFKTEAQQLFAQL